MDKIIKDINNVLQTKITHMFVGGEIVASEKSSILLKKYIKDNFESPKKDLKGYLIRISIDEKEKNVVSVNCVQVTLTPKLFIGPKDDDAFQIFTYTEKELLDNGFKMSHIKKMMKAVKNNLVSFEKPSISITQLLKKTSK